MSAPKAAAGVTRPARIAFVAGFLGIVLTLALEIFTETDIRLQDHLFNFQTGQWLIDPQATAPRFWFYTFPKLILFPLGGLLLLSCFRPKLRAKLRLRKREAAYLFCCLASIPLV